MRLILIISFLLTVVGCAQTESDGSAALSPVSADTSYVVGQDYRVLEQAIVDAPDVIELFFYGCEACSVIAPELESWSKERELTLGLVPVHSETQLVDAARLYHTLTSMGRGDLHISAFRLYREESDLKGEDRLNAFLSEQEVDQAEFWSAWQSEEVQQRLVGSYALNAMVRTRVTPTFIVYGKYVVEQDYLISDKGSVFSILDYLIELEK